MTSYQAYGNNTRVSPAPYTSAAPNPAGDGQFYPPGASRISLDDDSHTSPFKFKKGGDVAVNMRAINRTPSPTPSEAEELTKTSLFDWKAMSNWRYWIRKEWLCACYSPRVLSFPGRRLRILGTLLGPYALCQAFMLSVGGRRSLVPTTSRRCEEPVLAASPTTRSYPSLLFPATVAGSTGRMQCLLSR